MSTNIFISYSDQDEQLCMELLKHLRPLQREGLTHIWYKHDISAGNIRQQEVDKHLQAADIILLLISPDFMNSDYLFKREMQQAILRHAQEKTCVIPIILRPTHWQIAPLNALQPLPLDAKPIVLWHDRDEAFVHIVENIRTILSEQSGLMRSSPTTTYSVFTQDTKEPQQSILLDGNSIVENTNQLLECSTGSQTISASNGSYVKNVKQTARQCDSERCKG